MEKDKEFIISKGRGMGKNSESKRFIPGKSWIDVSGATITDEDKKILHEVVDDGWYTEDIMCRYFSQRLQKITGKKHIQLVNSGSSASLIAMTSAIRKFKRGWVLTCATAFPTTVAPIYQNGCIPVYIDIDPLTLQPKYGMIAEFLKNEDKVTSGAIFTHTMGFPFDEEFVSAVLGKKFLIADSCDALGSWNSRTLFEDELYPVGSFADLSTYSFFPAHHITTGEGGAVATNDPELAELARCYSSWGRSCFCLPGQSNTCGKRFEQEDRGGLPEGWDHKYMFSELGYNLKMTEFQGALGYSQSLRLDDVTRKRRENYQYLYKNLQSEYLYFIDLPKHASPFGFPILRNTNAPFSTNELVRFLESKKIRTRRLFAGNITQQPGYKHLPSIIPYSLDGSDRVMNDMIWVGIHPNLTKEMLEYVVEIFDELRKEYE